MNFAYFCALTKIMKKSILFIVNPIAGTRRKSGIESIIDRTVDRTQFDVRLVRTGKKGDGTVFARRAAEEGTDIVVAVGGDGTVNEVACGLAGSLSALGIIPCGSGNGLARHIGIPMNVRRAVNVLNTGRTVSIDRCTLNGHPFFCTCGVGFDAHVSMCFTASGKRGFLTYIEKTIGEWMKYKPALYELETDEGMRLKQKAVLITCANANQWGNEARIAPNASLTDGLMDVTIVEPFKAVEIVPLAIHLMNGTMDRSPRTRMFRCRKLVIRHTGEGPAHYDGDPARMGEELTVELYPAGLKAVVPAGKKNI